MHLKKDNMKIWDVSHSLSSTTELWSFVQLKKYLYILLTLKIYKIRCELSIYPKTGVFLAITHIIWSWFDCLKLSLFLIDWNKPDIVNVLMARISSELTIRNKNGHTVAVVRASPKLRLPSKVVFRQSSSSAEGCLPSKVVFHQRLSFIEGHLPSKVVFHKKLSSIKDCLQFMVVFHYVSTTLMLMPTLQCIAIPS